jgi:hypothetical protein
VGGMLRGSPSYQLRNFNANARINSQPNYYGYSSGKGGGGGSSGSELGDEEEMGGGGNYRTNPSTSDGWRSGRTRQPQTTANYLPPSGHSRNGPSSTASTTAIGYTHPYPDPPTPLEEPNNSYGIGMRSSAYASSYIPSTSSTHHFVGTNNGNNGLSQRSSAVSGSTNETTPAQFSSFV